MSFTPESLSKMPDRLARSGCGFGCLFLLCLVLSACAPIPASPVPATPVPTLIINDALRADAESYAENFGTTVDEAIQRMSLYQTIANLRNRLEKEEAATFVALWIQNAPDFRVIVTFTRNGQKIIQPYIRNTPLEKLVEVRTVKVSLAQLHSTQEKVNQIVRQLGFPYRAEINISEDRVELQVTDQAAWEAALKKARLKLPGNVKVIVLYTPLSTTPLFALTPVPGLFLPQLRVRSTSFMAALLRGRLVAKDGCLRVVQDGVDASFLIIWQPDYFLNDNQGSIQVLNRSGKVAARMGDMVSLGGGGVPLSSFASLLRAPLPAQCNGPYWLMGEVVSQK
jgi:hypothetical protein